MINKTDKTTATAILYTIGFVLSIGLTYAAYSVTKYSVSGNQDRIGTGLATAWVVGLAILQLVVQLVFFLHLGEERKPRIRLVAFLFSAMVVLIIGIGSLWIMNNLDYHDHSKGTEVEREILLDEGFHKGSDHDSSHHH